MLACASALSHPPGFSLHLLGEVPSSVRVTCFESDVLTGETMRLVIGRIVRAVKQATFEIPIDPTEFALPQYKDALAFLDAEQRKGKVVVTVA